MAKIRPRARIIRTIGDQLISGPEAAIIELVKNAYDADAASVKITMRAGHPDGQASITVVDDGHGMSAEDVITKWLEPATSDKVIRKVSPKRRPLLGAKGVGRFATSRLGSTVQMKSRKVTSVGMQEVTFSINWEEFENFDYLDEIDVEIESRIVSESLPTGVMLEISNLRDSWTKKQLEGLIKELRRLSSPLDYQENGFSIYLDLGSFTEDLHGFDGRALLSGQIVEVSEGDADFSLIRPFSLGGIFHYRLEGDFDELGRFSGKFINRRADGLIQSVEIDAPTLSSEEVGCGPFSVAINIYDREGEAIVDLFQKMGLSNVGRMDARRILDENIGVGIYRNGFRIRPYGDAETDWLELERKRVQNPSQRLGLNQLWGTVFVAEESSSGLIERSSREGLEHNGSFIRLRRLMNDAMARAEILRFDFRTRAGLSRKLDGDPVAIKERAGLQSMARAIEKLPPQYRDGMRRALKQESKALKSSIEELEDFQHKLAAQSSVGLVVSQVLHDGRRFLGDINTRSKLILDGAPRLLEESAFGNHYRGSLSKNATSVKESAGSLTKLFKALDPLASRKRGRPKSLDPIAVVERCFELSADAVNDNSIRVVVRQPKIKSLVIVYEADLMAAVLNIVDNAIHWLSIGGSADREIVVDTSISKKWVRLSISNNGPKVDEIVEGNLFKPGFTLKPEGSGIGLAIAREAMKASKGKVEYDPNADDVCFVIYLQRDL